MIRLSKNLQSILFLQSIFFHLISLSLYIIFIIIERERNKNSLNIYVSRRVEKRKKKKIAATVRKEHSVLYLLIISTYT